MNDSGEQVFGDNIDEILSNKIINHTELSERKEELNKQDKEKKESFSTFLKFILITLSVSTIFYLSRKLIYRVLFKNQ